jgi:alpha-galactosidase
MRHPPLALTLRIAVAAALPWLAAALPAQKVKVYVLAGQSNMEGHAKIATFDYLADDPATAPLLGKMRGRDGTPTVRDDVWITYLTHGGEATGPLTAGYGARRAAAKSDDKIGPEFTFGITMGEAHGEPVVLIKTAWGGKSLHTDFRPPSAGAYVFDQDWLDAAGKRGQDVDRIRAEKAAATGHHYRLMIDHVRQVLADLGRVCPRYSERAGYELAGFVWFQGWNDMVDRGTYPRRDQPGGYDRYSEVLAHFIRDVRGDLDAPELPFVIGVMGVGGPVAEDDRSRAVHRNFQAAMAAPAALPEFRGKVTAVATAPFWPQELAAIADESDRVRNLARQLKNQDKNGPNKDGTMSDAEQQAYVERCRAELITPEEQARFERGASNAGYHYMGCAKTMAQIGVAFADAMLSMER